MSSLQDLLAQRAEIEKKIADVQREERATAINKVRAMMAEFGLTAADIAGKASAPKAPGTAKPTTELVLSHKHPADRRQVASTLEAMRRTGAAFSTRHRIIDTAGVVHHVVVVGDQLFDDDGAVVGTQGFYVEVTPAISDVHQQVVSDAVAEIAENYFTLMSLDKRLEILDATIALQEQSLKVAIAWKDAARGTEVGVQRFQAEVRKNQSERLVVQQDIIEAENRIHAQKAIIAWCLGRVG